MICKNCGKEFFDDWRKDKETKKEVCRFCCKGCANTRKHSKETKQKISIGLINSFKNNPEIKERQKIKNVKNLAKLNQFALEWRKKQKEKLLTDDFSTLSFEKLRKRVMLEQEEKCNHCGTKEWMGKKIILELEHIDGNHHNNDRSNLEAICPNCHSLTSTWRGRNVKNRIKKISDDDLFEAFIKTGNIRKCLLSIGLAAKGKNYGRVKKILTLREIKLEDL